MTKSQLLMALELASVPAGPINTVAEVFADPQVAARGLRQDLPARAGDAKTVPSVRSPLRFSESVLTYDHAAPPLGESTQGILADLGYTDAAAGQLARDAVVEWPANKGTAS